MPRSPRVVIPGLPHHITQRGNYRQNVFLSDDDREAYIARLHLYSRLYHLRIHAFCLMSNHVHLVATPDLANSLARTLGRLQSDLARSINFHKGEVGHLWQGRFYSAPMDLHDSPSVIAYVEQNPLRAGMVQHPCDYPWSSAYYRCENDNMNGLLDLSYWQKEYTPERWKEVLATSIQSEAHFTRIREATRRGMPFGNERFIEELCRRYGRDFTRHKPGRPPRHPDHLAACA